MVGFISMSRGFNCLPFNYDGNRSIGMGITHNGNPANGAKEEA